MKLAARLGVIYGVAAVFPLLSWWMTPEAPQLESHSVVFHKTHFFASPSELLREPLAGLGKNLAPLLEFLGAYLTWAAVVGCVAACVYLLAKRSSSAWVLLAVSAVPIGLQVLVLTRFFSRYAFPHIWPLLLLCGLAFVELRKTTLGRFAGAAFLLVVAVSLTARSVAIVNDPVRSLAPSDSSYYFSDRPNAGFGVRQVVNHLLTEAEKGPLLLLTDPIWSTPADAMFPFLNRRQGIRVHEAWWIESAPNHPILHGRGAEVWRSHYERVLGGTLDFSDFRAIYYVTLTNYRSRGNVSDREPAATLELFVPKPGRKHSLDLYRLR